MQEKKEQNKPINFKFNFKIYWVIIKNYKLLIFFILFLILYFQSVHVLERFFFKLITDKGTDFVSKIIDYDAFVNFLIIIAIIYIIIIILNSIFRWVYLHLVNKFETNIMLDLKKMMFNHILNLDYKFHISNKTGSLISRLIRGGTAIERLTDVLIFNFMPLIFQLIIISISIAFFDITSVIVILITALIFMIYSLYINKKQQKANLNANDAEDFEKGMVSNYLTNIETIKYFGKEKRVKNNYFDIGNLTRIATLKHWNYFRALSFGHNLILGFGTFFIIFFPIKKLLIGDITLGTIIFIYTTFGLMINYLFHFDHGLRGFYRSMADFESLFKYYKVKKIVLDSNNAKNLKIKKGTVEFKNVYFKYNKNYVLKDFSLRIPQKKKVALVGLSGSGKSTLVKLIYRLYDINKGQITIDGIDIKDLKQESLRSELSIVPQEAILFDDTLYNNIAFSKKNATKKDVFKAIKFAQLHKIVQTFQNKEQTIVGERGIKLSGGERQRVSIARAILANKKILILDEATSALDSKTEHDIQKDLEKLMEGRTSIVIAHRLSTIMKADIIVVMDKGNIAQIGTHKELIKKEGLYKKLWSLQKGGYIK
jgi:ATP-binding cassette, subfamily B, heavy metal transporter